MTNNKSNNRISNKWLGLFVIMILVILFLIVIFFTIPEFTKDEYLGSTKDNDWYYRPCRLVSTATSMYIGADEDGLITFNILPQPDNLWLYIYSFQNRNTATFFNRSNSMYLNYPDYENDAELRADLDRFDLNRLYTVVRLEGRDDINILPSVGATDQALYVNVSDDDLDDEIGYDVDDMLNEVIIDPINVIQSGLVLENERNSRSWYLIQDARLDQI